MTKTIIVTGASRGIGYETALYLASNNHTVIATARSEDKLQELSKKATDGKIIPIAADLTKPGDIKNLQESAKEFSSIDGIINNAGALEKAPFMETDLSVFKHLMEVNVYGIVRIVQAMKPQLKDGSHILNISSMSGYQGSLKFGGLTAYGAAKAAVAGLSEVLSAEFADHGIAVNCLCIGAVQTEMFEEAFPGFQAPVSPREMGKYIGNFIINGHKFYNGKVLPVALNDPG